MQYADIAQSHNALVGGGLQPKVGRVRQPKPAARFEINEAAIGGPAPRIGEHSRDVLRELGYDDSAIDRMLAERSVRVAV
jgi:crotonobetainyl-CoA:carnitine CoA-transferase CaiB-like acyl-CoA transferase